MQEITPDRLRLGAIFFPSIMVRQIEVSNAKRRFVHYTTAESAKKMIEGASVWMRKSRFPNDYIEAEYGKSLAGQVHGGAAGQRFEEALEAVFPSITEGIARLFGEWIRHYEWDTYVASFSEHDASEDHNGRLSMWRAYASTSPVAIVVKSEPMVAVTDALDAYTRPVTYFDQTELEAEPDKTTLAIKADPDFLSRNGCRSIPECRQKRCSAGLSRQSRRSLLLVGQISWTTSVAC